MLVLNRRCERDYIEKDVDTIKITVQEILDARILQSFEQIIVDARAASAREASRCLCASASRARIIYASNSMCCKPNTTGAEFRFMQNVAHRPGNKLSF